MAMTDNCDCLEQSFYHNLCRHNLLAIDRVGYNEFMEWLKSKAQSKTVENSQTAHAEVRGRNDLDRIYALLRRMKTQIIEIDAKVSTCRRDINRIDRKGYREDSEPLHVIKKQEVEPSNGGRASLMRMFGGK